MANACESTDQPDQDSVTTGRRGKKISFPPSPAALTAEAGTGIAGRWTRRHVPRRRCGRMAYPAVDNTVR
jgi:hypothetical protein